MKYPRGTHVYHSIEVSCVTLSSLHSLMGAGSGPTLGSPSAFPKALAKSFPQPSALGRVELEEDTWKNMGEKSV